MTVPLDKIVSITNVGRYVKFAASGDVTFRRLSLIYGPNGSGKTTLAAVLRSLATGEAAFIDERATLGAQSPPRVQVRLAAGNALFEGGTWTGSAAPPVEVFDATFTNDNVYTGEHVDAQHRKNLYEVVVGGPAVALAKRIDEIDAEGRGLSREMSSLETQLREHIQAPFGLDDFLVLPPDPAVEGKIREKTTQLSAVRKSKEILARRSLQVLPVPHIPDTIRDALSAGITSVSAKVSERVLQHVRQHLDSRGEQWLRQGVDYAKAGESCPFCAQPLASSELAPLLASYFSSEYRAHVIAIERALNATEQLLGTDALGELRRRALDNDGVIQGWSDLADLAFSSLKLDRIEPRWQKLRGALMDTFSDKLAHPGAATTPDPRVEAALADFGDALGTIDQVNLEIARANEQISSLKRESAVASQELLEAELRRLRNSQIRHTQQATELCSKLLEARQRRADLEEEKRKTREALEALAATTLSTYESEINRLLKAFGATFALTGTKPSFAGGKASSTYKLAVNETAVDLGDSGTPRGTPCFRTVLSAGDKSTLALAFFLARLHQDGALATKVVVFDDPLSSLDSFRTFCTKDEILKTVEASAQVIVLSHDPHFLKRLRDAASGASVKSLQVIKQGDTYVLREWDIDRYCREAAHQDYFVLRTFLDEGVADETLLLPIARAIRPFLEAHLRFRFPDEFFPTDSLGNILDKIAASPPGSVLASVRGSLSELTLINDYSKAYHHSNPPKPAAAELSVFVEKAIAFGHGR